MVSEGVTESVVKTLAVIPANAGIQSIKQSLATHYKVSLRDFFPLDSCLRRNDGRGRLSWLWFGHVRMPLLILTTLPITTR